jgi:hypothetical protein
MADHLIYDGQHQGIGPVVRWRMEVAMWATIQSRTRRATRGFAVFFVMASVGVASGCKAEQPFPLFPSPHLHTYLSWVLAVTPAPPWHPGQSLSLKWLPIRSEMDGQPPRTVSCHFALYGPYSTSGDAQAHVTTIEIQPSTDTPPADSSPSLTLSTDPAAQAPEPLAHTLPAALALGYYAVEGSVDAGDTAGGCGGGWMVEVAA